MKARNAAIAAGKVRNASKTAKVAKKVTIAKKDMAKASLTASIIVTGKKAAQIGYNKISNDKSTKNINTETK